MKTLDIHNLIEEASEIERQTLVLYDEIERYFQRKGMAVNDTDVEKIYEFVFNYIRHVPELLAMIHERAEHQRILQHVKPILLQIQEVFLRKDELIPERFGLVALLDNAYLAHELIQGISDQYRLRSGKNLLTSTLTEANRVVRVLIGDKNGNILDNKVLQTLNSQTIQEGMALLLANEKGINLAGPDPVWGYASVSDIAASRLSSLGVS